MASVTLGTLKGYWQNVSQWVNGTLGNVPHVAVNGKNERIRNINVDSTTVVSAGTSEIIQITPAVGYKAKVIGLYMESSMPTGFTSGSQVFKAYISSEYAHLAFEVSRSDGKLKIESNELFTGDFVNPSTNDVLNRNILGLEFDDNEPLQIKYYNGTDVDQSDTRNIRLVVKEEAVI